MIATLYLLGCMLAPAPYPGVGEVPIPSGPRNNSLWAPPSSRGSTLSQRPRFHRAFAPRTTRGGKVDPEAAPGYLRGETLLVPHLRKNQELLYRGTYEETIRSSGAELHRAYRIHTRIFVLDTPPKGMNVAFLTLIKKQQGPRIGISGEPQWQSVRLEQARVNLQGRVKPSSVDDLTIPLEGVPSLECSAFLEAPREPARVGDAWPVAEKGRPVRTWRVVGPAMLHGVRCLKLEGTQESEHWKKPRADERAWSRKDLVWLNLRLGVAARVERTILHRLPGHTRPSQRSVFQCELERAPQYPGRLAKDRRQEIAQALALRKELAPMLHRPARYRHHLDAMLQRISHHLEYEPPTPYREAIRQIKRRVEAAQRGEKPPVLPVSKPNAPRTAVRGRKAPDFLVPQFGHTGSFRLHDHLGKPTLLVFYRPTSPTTEAVLRYAQTMHTSRYGVQVLGLTIGSKSRAILAQKKNLGLTFPLLDGSGLYASYGVEATPKFVLLDGKGSVRATYLGWGNEIPTGLVRELRRWLPSSTSKK